MADDPRGPWPRDAQIRKAIRGSFGRSGIGGATATADAVTTLVEAVEPLLRLPLGD
ncbi:hypothetical protein ABT369_50255 [Dactylosporangium sp. NPDC000244]|uniref:hypothetical protein n=1 Tax=Dactylosporangium sp. NPDC000244 TaxID=3154365 RepID=UPI0033189CD7